MTPQRYEVAQVPVRGGTLAVGVWEPSEAEPIADVIAIHGITASHRAFAHLAAHLPGVRIIAPDLRGRGGSSDVDGPAGMAVHADDIADVAGALGVDRAVVVGHSMGGFVAMVLAHRHPSLVARTLIVDGGLPLDVPSDLDPEVLVAAILGPTAERLSMRFTTPEEYLDYWRPHPAFAVTWDDELEGYFRYDLVEDGHGYRPATALSSAVDDTADMVTGTALADALVARPAPVRLLTVPRGLQDERPGLYAEDHLRTLLASNPQVEHERLEPFNHYTVVMSPAGGRAIAERVEQEIAATRRGALA